MVAIPEMKICLLMSEVLPVPAVRGGAVETLVMHWLKSQESSRESHEVHIVSRFERKAQKQSREFSRTNFHWVRPLPCEPLFKRVWQKFIPRTPFSDIYLKRGLKKLKKLTFDVVVVENRPEFLERVRRTFPKAKVILHLHNDTLNSETVMGYEKIQATDKILCISEFIRNRVLTVPKSSPSKVQVLYNAVDSEQFFYQPQRTLEPLNLVFLGRISSFKGAGVFVQAVLQLNTKYPNIHVKFVGSSAYQGSQKDSYQKMLAQQLSNSRLSVEWTGYVPQAQLPQQLANASVLVIPSRWQEPAGLTVLEGMSLGIPVVASRVGGIPEYLTEAEGWLVEFSKKEEEMAQELEKVLDNVINHYPLALQKAKVARKKVEQSFSSQTYWHRFIESLETA